MKMLFELKTDNLGVKGAAEVASQSLTWPLMMIHIHFHLQIDDCQPVPMSAE